MGEFQVIEQLPLKWIIKIMLLDVTAVCQSHPSLDDLKRSHWLDKTQLKRSLKLYSQIILGLINSLELFSNLNINNVANFEFLTYKAIQSRAGPITLDIIWNKEKLTYRVLNLGSYPTRLCNEELVHLNQLSWIYLGCSLHPPKNI